MTVIPSPFFLRRKSMVFEHQMLQLLLPKSRLEEMLVLVNHDQ